MIFVALGTQDKSFIRLLNKIEEICRNGTIKDKIIVQSGYTHFDSEFMDVREYIDKNEFDNIIKNADLIISHGGVGTIMNALNYEKIIIGIPRLKKYGEHHNDHQKEILSSLASRGYILYCDEMDNLESIIEKSKNFKIKKYTSDPSAIIKRVKEFIDSI
ncbi:MAG: PssE/Cps14G family polysaccharide biosynthesis glycosyltransferase [Anaerorhabdus sp.]